MTKTVTVGIIGSGYACQLHCNGYRKISGILVRLKTIVDINAEKAKSVAKTFGIEHILTDYRELFNDEEIDIVDICTPPFLHTQIAKEALQAGKHVICE